MNESDDTMGTSADKKARRFGETASKDCEDRLQIKRDVRAGKEHWSRATTRSPPQLAVGVEIAHMVGDCSPTCIPDGTY